MVRRLVLGMMLMGCAASVQALGLGDIHARSALNQNFEADIDLVSVARGEIDGVRVNLASAEAFQRAGVDRPFSLSSLRFEPMRLPDGRAVVRVTTDTPVREPFMNFLVEVNWPNGRLVREYTVLLDPPTTTQRRAAPVQAPATTTAAPRYTPPAAAPAPAAQAQPAVDEYGPVQSGETLWVIARKVRPSGVTMEQMMIALQQANPQAFLRGNVNLLKKGQILRVPEREEILAINRQEARQVYREQQDAWLNAQAGKMRDGEAAAAAADADKATGDTAQLRLATPRPEGKGKAGAAEDDASKPTVDNLATDLLIAQENAETARQESELLRSQVSELEMHLSNMERLLTLKDNQLARLQSNIAAEPTGIEVRPAAEASAEQPAAESPAEEAPAAQAPAEEAVSEAMQTEEPVEAVEQQAAAEPEAAAAGEQPQAEPVTAEAEAAKEVAAPAEEAVEQKPADSGIMGEPLTLAAIGLAVLAVIGVLIARLRGRRKEEEEEAEDEGMGESILQEPEPEEEVSEITGAGDTSLLSEFSPSDVQALQDDTTEVDPLSEADVYVAYGRYQQAEDLLNQALQKEPDRLALKQKLLDVYHAKPDVAAFVALASELAAAGMDTSDEEGWAHISEMGRELAPEEEMFRGPDDLEIMPDIEAEAEDLGLSELADLAEDESVFMPDMASESDSESLGLTSSYPTSSGLDESLDIELPSLEVPSEGNEGQEEEEDILSLDLELEDEAEVKKQASGAELDIDDEDVLSIDDLDDFSELTEELSQLEEASALLDEPIALEVPEGEDELDLELDMASSDVDTLASDLDEADEVDTKLDLARAYLEMGDSEGARGLLDEVMDEGNDAQKTAASELLGSL